MKTKTRTPKSKIRYWIFSLTLPIIWLFMMGTLYQRHSSRSILEMDPKVSITNPSQVILREEWRGIYLNNEKVGYSHFILREGRGTTVKNVYELTNETNLTLLLGGTKQQIQLKGYSTLDQDLKLIGFQQTMKTGNQINQFRGTITNDRLRVQIEGLGGRSSKSVPLKEKPYSTDAIHLFLLKNKFTLHKKFQIPVFDPISLSTIPMEIEVMEKTKITLGNETREVYYIQQRLKGLVQESWVSPKGEVLKENASIAGLNFTTLNEPDNIALKIVPQNNITQDILYQTAVRVTGTISDPRNINHLQVKIFYDHTRLTIPVDDRQRLISINTGIQPYLLMNIRRIDLKKPGKFITLEKEELSKYLESTPLIQSNDPEIVEQAYKIVKDRTPEITAVDKLANWVHQHMRRKLLVSIPSAKDILKNRTGDCNEHSVLFAALARSIGIPTKIAIGIVYVNGGFFYHAWNEVWVGEWVPIDTTFGQTSIDPTHIKLLEGDIEQSYQIVQYIGNLEIEIIESSKGI